MKPVEKGAAPRVFAAYSEAKPELIGRLGSHCSYCEQAGAPQSLHVEHIYPQDPHPELENDWNNFLVACPTCNTYKHHHLGSTRQANLETRYLWPHRDNTFRAFKYLDDGRVEVAGSLPPDVRTAAMATIEMTGLLRSPAKAADYDELGVAYDGIKKRKEMWEIAIGSRLDYNPGNGTQSATRLARCAAKLGFFSIWMEVFHDRPEVRRELLVAFNADTACFDGETRAVTKGRF